jgi:hypothetical protein
VNELADVFEEELNRLGKLEKEQYERFCDNPEAYVDEFKDALYREILHREVERIKERGELHKGSYAYISAEQEANKTYFAAKYFEWSLKSKRLLSHFTQHMVKTKGTLDYVWREAVMPSATLEKGVHYYLNRHLFGIPPGLYALYNMNTTSVLTHDFSRSVGNDRNSHWTEEDLYEIGKDIRVVHTDKDTVKAILQSLKYHHTEMPISTEPVLSMVVHHFLKLTDQDDYGGFRGTVCMKEQFKELNDDFKSHLKGWKKKISSAYDLFKGISYCSNTRESWHKKQEYTLKLYDEIMSSAAPKLYYEYKLANMLEGVCGDIMVNQLVWLIDEVEPFKHDIGSIKMGQIFDLDMYCLDDQWNTGLKKSPGGFYTYPKGARARRTVLGMPWHPSRVSSSGFLQAARGVFGLDLEKVWDLEKYGKFREVGHNEKGLLYRETLVNSLMQFNDMPIRPTLESIVPNLKKTTVESEAEPIEYDYLC